MSENPTSSLQEEANQLEEIVSDLFSVHDVALGLPGRPETIRLRGRLLVPSDRAYPQIAERLRNLGYTVYLQRDREHELDVLLAEPGIAPQEAPSRIGLNVLLYALTILATLFVGASYSEQVPATDDALLWILTHLWVGWPFALSLMAILTGHELGHYFAARYYKVPVSLPFFIPLPLPPLGTMGAFIVMKGRSVSRRQMLTVGAAGPLVGFIIAVPILILGLNLSEIRPLVMPEPGTSSFFEGNSILYILLKLSAFGQVLPGSGATVTASEAFREALRAWLGVFPIDTGYDVFIHPVALAGWAGLLVTAFNLLPVGQLDGGHVLYSLIGQRARMLTWPVIGFLVLMGLVFWQGWLVWAALVFFFGRYHPDPLDDVTRLDPARKAVAVLVLVIFVLTFTPLPLRYISIPLPEAAGQEPVGCLAGIGLILGGVAWLATRAWAKRRGASRPRG
jgi:Zn-dependent protease